jgi:hypothetical protein
MYFPDIIAKFCEIGRSACNGFFKFPFCKIPESIMMSEQESYCLVAPELANIIFLSIGALQMYNGIEIAHPVYQVNIKITFILILWMFLVQIM